MQRGPRSPFFMREVLPDGPRAVPMPELLRSGPRPVPMPRTGPEAPFDGTLGGELRAPRRPQGTKPGGTEAIPKELEDAVETLVP